MILSIPLFSHFFFQSSDPLVIGSKKTINTTRDSTTFILFFVTLTTYFHISMKKGNIVLVITNPKPNANPKPKA